MGGGQSSETRMSFLQTLSNSLKEKRVSLPLAIFLRSVTSEASLLCGRAHVKSLVLNQMLRTSPFWEQSKAFVQDGSSSATFKSSTSREFLYSFTKVIRESFALKGTTDGISFIVFPCATGGWLGEGMDGGIVELVKY